MTEFEPKIVAYTDDKPMRKRACINCELREPYKAGSTCGYDGHYIGYVDTWDDWCRHWHKDRQEKPYEGRELNG